VCGGQALLAQRERVVRRAGRKAVAAQGRRLGVAREQQTVVRQQRAKARRCPRLRGVVEVDQQVAADDEVVGTCPERIEVEQVGLFEGDVGARRRIDHAGVAVLREEAGLQALVVAAERVARVAAGAGARDGGVGYVERVDAACFGRNACARQQHGQRIRFLATGARQRQHANGASRPRRQACLHEAQRGLEHGGVAQDPRFRHHDEVDERVEFCRAGLRIVVETRAGLPQALAHGPFDGGDGQVQPGGGA
jgi:hypothetical protein